MKYMTAEHAGQCGRFLKLPLDVFERDLSPLAKLLYTYLLDLTTLSAKNKHYDKRGVYVFCTVESAAKLLACCRDKAMSCFDELEKEQLIFRKRRKGPFATQIYLVDSVDHKTGKKKKGSKQASKKPSKPSTKKVDHNDLHGGQKRPAMVDHIDSNQTDKNQTDFNQTGKNKTGKNQTERSLSASFSFSSPVLPAYDMTDQRTSFALTRAKCHIAYFQRLAQGESMEVLQEELERELSSGRYGQVLKANRACSLGAGS